MKQRKSFLIHIDSLDILDDLTDSQCGQLLRAIKDYQTGNQSDLEPLVKVAFSPFKNQFKRDEEKYQKTCEARALAGSKGGKQKVANASKSKQKVANLAENKNKNKTKNKSDSKNINTIVAGAPKFNFKNQLISLGVKESTARDWLEVRKKKKAANTETALNGLIKQISESGLTPQKAIEMATEQSWAGFKAKWVANNDQDFSDTSTGWAGKDWGLL